MTAAAVVAVVGYAAFAVAPVPTQVDHGALAKEADLVDQLRLSFEPAEKRRALAPAKKKRLAPETPTASATPEPAVSPASGAGLVGSIGYALPYGNCVNEPGVNNPHDGTNPSSWPATSATPWIGATALFGYNHVGVVSGIWSNGDLEIRHQNYYGGQHRFPRSTFRGFR